MSPASYGLYLPNFGPFGDASVLVELARDAERAGWDGLFLWDHVARPIDTDVVDPAVALAAIAAATRSLRLGALVTPLPRRRPWKLARETVSLDRLSDGRLVLGVGTGSSGGFSPEWQAFGEELDGARRGEMLDEGLEILTGLWSGERFTFRGRHFSVEEVRFLPRPVQRPRIPIWVAGYWPARRPFARAGRWDGVFPLFRDAGSPGDLSDVVRFVRAHREGDAPFDVIHLGEPTPGDDPARATALVEPWLRAGATWWLERIAPQREGVDWEDPWPLDALVERVRRGPPRP